MITRVLAVGLLAGTLAGLAVAVLQEFTTTPIILVAETYEHGARAAPQGEAFQFLANERARVMLVHDHSGHGNTTANDGDQEWEPRAGLERTLYSSIATIATSIGFALMILAGMLFAGDPIDERRAMIWAAAGFVATGLATSAGLPPEVPGIESADLVARQLWWLATAAATAAGIWLILRNDSSWMRLAGVSLILAPHLWGAPHLANPGHSVVPAYLAGEFAAKSLALHAVLWALTGFFVGFWWRRIGSHGSEQTT